MKLTNPQRELLWYASQQVDGRVPTFGQQSKTLAALSDAGLIAQVHRIDGTERARILGLVDENVALAQSALNGSETWERALVYLVTAKQYKDSLFAVEWRITEAGRREGLQFVSSAAGGN